MATLQKRKGNRLSRFFSVSEIKDPKIVVPDERRAVSHSTQAILPERTAPPSNAPWVPPQQHARSSSAQIAKNNLLAPLAPPAEIHRRPVGGTSSATTSPNTSRPPSGYSSQPSSPYRSNLTPHSTSTLGVPGASPAASPERVVNKRRSWFGGSGQKLSKGNKDAKEEKPPAWIVGIEGQKPAYDLNPLLSAQQVSIRRIYYATWRH
jgi:hypothetical protein